MKLKRHSDYLFQNIALLFYNLLPLSFAHFGHLLRGLSKNISYNLYILNHLEFSPTLVFLIFFDLLSLIHNRLFLHVLNFSYDVK